MEKHPSGSSSSSSSSRVFSSISLPAKRTLVEDAVQLEARDQCLSVGFDLVCHSGRPQVRLCHVKILGYCH